MVTQHGKPMFTQVRVASSEKMPSCVNVKIATLYVKGATFRAVGAASLKNPVHLLGEIG